MKDQFTHLEKLQQIDVQLIALEDRLEQVPEHIAVVEKQIAETERAVADARAEHKHQVELRAEKRRELDLESIRLRNTKKKEAQIQNQREMDAYVRELSTIEQTIRELEGQNQQVETQEREAAESLKQHEIRLETQRREAAALRQKWNESNRSTEEAIDKLYAQRNEVIANIDRRLQQTYKLIADRTDDGVAVAQTTGGTCSSCHMVVPLQIYNELLRRDRLHQCPSCRRILLPDATRQAAG